VRKQRKQLPRRLCVDPGTKYCQGHKNSRQPWGHRGCCECWEANAGDDGQAACRAYLLPERVAELKIWWEENEMGPWDDGGGVFCRRNMKKRGKKWQAR
jgi:hypothetical protein